MVWLLLAILVCFLVPWLPVWVYRSLPRRPPDPPGAARLHLLAQQLPPPTDTLEIVEPGLPEDDAPAADITRRPASTPKAPTTNAEQAAAPKEPGQPVSQPAIGSQAPARRLTLTGYRAFSIAFVPLFIVAFLGLGFGWAALLHWLGEERARAFPPSVFLFKPFYGIVFATPAIFLGIFSAIPLLIVLARLLMGQQRFLEYLFWDEGRMNSQGMNPEGAIRVISLLAFVISVLAVVFACLVLNWYARFTEDEIAIKRLFGFGEEVHSYDSVEQIVVSTRRKVGKEEMDGPDLGLRFRDGKVWTTDQSFQLPHDPAERDRIIAFLQRKTGKPITRVRLLKDVPGM